MNRSIFVLGNLCLSASIIAGPVVAGSSQTTPGAAPAQVGASPTQTVAAIDTPNFLRMAGVSSEAELALATLAEQKATSDQVKQYAEQLKRDHTAANADILRLAASRGLKIPETPAAKRETASRLARTEGAEFDRAYVVQMVSDHRASIALFERAAASTEAPIKAFAEKTLPVLTMHLQRAQELSSSLR